MKKDNSHSKGEKRIKKILPEVKEADSLSYAINYKANEFICSNSDLYNLLQSTEVAAIFLTPALQVKGYTPHIGKIFKTTPSDIGRPLKHLTNYLTDHNFQKDAAKVLKNLQTFEREVHLLDNRYYIVRFSPYRTIENKIDGVVLTFIDITERKNREANLAFLNEVSDHLISLTGVSEIVQTVGTMSGEFFGASICAFIEINESKDEARVFDEWQKEKGQTLIGHYNLPEYTTEEFKQTMSAGKAVVVRDVAKDTRIFNKEKFAALKIASFINAPLIQEGEWRFTLGIYHENPYNWRNDQIELVLETSVRIWNKLQRTRAEEFLAKSEEKLSAFVDATSDIIYEMNADWSKMNFLRGKEFIKTTQKPRTDWLEEYIPDDEKTNVWAVIENALETKSVFELEHRIFRIDGSIGWTFSRAIPLFDEAGEIVKWFGTASDISEQKEVEKALRRADIRFRTMADTAPVLIWETDENGVSYINRHYLEFFGVSFKNLSGMGWKKFLHPEDSAEYLKIYQKAFSKRKPYKHECRFRRSDGDYRWLLNIGHPLGENQFVGCSVDITENKRAEENLRQNHEMFYALVEKAPFGVYLVDSDFCLLQINGGAQAVFNNIEPLIGRDMSEILHIVWEEPFASEAIAHFRHTLQTGESFISTPIIEKRANTQEIEAYDWQIHRITLPNSSFGVVCYFYDLSPQMRLEAAVHESEERFSKAFNASPLVLTISSLTTGELIEVNETFYNVTGYKRKEVIGKTTLELGLWKYAAERDAELEEVRQMGQLRNHEYIFRTKSGKEIIGLLAAEKIEIGGEQFALTVIQDITIQKRAEQALRESEERLRNLIESVTEYAIFTMTLDGIIDSWNTGAQRIFGFSETEALGKSAKIIFTPEDNQKNAAEKEMQTALTQGRAADERFHLRSDGTRFYVSGVLMPLVRNNKAAGFVKIARDLTQQLTAEKNQHDKEMLQKLVKAQEDERRRIARDLHDELGQQLTGLRLKLEHLRKFSKQASISQTIDEIQSIAKGIDEGVDFIAWELRPTALDDLGLLAALKKYVKEWSEFSKIKAELSIVGRKKLRLLPEAETNLYRITQEALNNVHKHAAAQKVEVVVTERNKERILIISDDGKGFDLESKIKENKGLGLVGMQERAVLIGGNLEIESEEGKGTTIFVHVPSN